MRNSRPRREVSDRAFLAAGLFARLATALDRNDFSDAADARDQLIELGYSVRVGHPAEFKPATREGVAP